MNTSNSFGEDMKQIEKEVVTKKVVLRSFALYVQIEFGQIFSRSRTNMNLKKWKGPIQEQ